MVRLATFCALLAGPIAAETITCDLGGDMLRFTIDHSQFVNPQDPNDPPRRKITTVQYADKQFPAEPIVMGDLRGFHAEGLGGTAALFIVQPGGAAALTNHKLGQRIEGTCQVVD